MSAERSPVMPPWTKDDTVDYLNANPLPADFTWRGKTVVPYYRIHGGFGKWLRETPNHRGLFQVIHELLARIDPLPSAEALALRLYEEHPLAKPDIPPHHGHEDS